MVLHVSSTTRTKKGPEPKKLEKKPEPMSLNDLLLSSVKTTFLGQFLLVPKQTTNHNKRYQHQRQYDTAAAVREVEETVRTEDSTTSHDIRDEWQAKAVKQDGMKRRLREAAAQSSGANKADVDFPDSDWNMREDCSIPDDFPAKSSLKTNKSSSEQKGNSDHRGKSSLKSSSDHRSKPSLSSNSDHRSKRHSRTSGHNHRRSEAKQMSQSENFHSTRRSSHETASTMESSRLSPTPLHTTYEERWSQSRVPPTPSKSTRGRRPTVPVVTLPRSKSSRALGSSRRSSEESSSTRNTVDKPETIEHSYRDKRRSSRRQSTSRKPDKGRSMSKSDPGRSSSRRRSSSKKSSHSKRSSRRESSMHRSTPHLHHLHETSDKKRSSRRRSSIGSSAPHHDTSSRDHERRRGKEKTVADTWKPSIPLRSTGVAVDILKNDSHRLPLSDELKIINASSGQPKTKIGGRLSQSSQATKTTAASTLHSDDTSVGLPDLKPMAADLAPKKAKCASMGFSVVESPIVASIEW